MSSDDKDRLLSHDYDGIEEYDNPLPGWWVWTFWATIAFSVVYVGYYHLGPGLSVHEQYALDVRSAAERQAKLEAAAGTATDDSIRALLKDAKVMAAAREIFATRCAPCHGQKGEGVIGPNLVDEYWLHGGKPTEVLRTISEGVPEKGMVPWKGQLQPAELSAMAAYIMSLAGSTPPNAKPPQGEKASGEAAPAGAPRS